MEQSSDVKIVLGDLSEVCFQNQNEIEIDPQLQMRYILVPGSRKAELLH